MKPEPPPYPRPVPSIDFDEDPILPGTVIYTAEDDRDSKERAAKRRRIEENATAYLRGEDLFILSAGLRGPFDASWRNPWARKSSKRKLEVGTEDRSPKRVQLAQSTRRCAQRLPQESPDLIAKSRTKSGNPFERTIKSSEPPGNSEKVESWLRRNSALSQGSLTAPTTPTPKKKAAWTEKDGPKPTWTPTKQRITVSSQDLKAPMQHLTTRVADSFGTIVPPGAQFGHQVDAHARLQTALHVESAVTDVEQNGNQPQKLDANSCSIGIEAGRPVRAEEAIMKIKRKPQEHPHVECVDESSSVTKGQTSTVVVEKKTTKMKPPNTIGLRRSHSSAQPDAGCSATPSAGQEHHKRHRTVGKQQDGPEVKLKKLEALIDQCLQDNHEDRKDGTSRELEPSITTETNLPHFSTAVSDVHSTKLPPSAQHKPELHASASNISSGALLPDVSPQVTKHDDPLNEGVDVSNGDAVASAPDFESSKHDQSPQSARICTPSSRPGDMANIGNTGQQNPKISWDNIPREDQSQNKPQRSKLPALEPVGTNRLSQTSLDGLVAKSPTSGLPAKGDKMAKKTSFAPDSAPNSSLGSIKNVLKVQKSDFSGKVQKATPPLSFSKHDPQPASVTWQSDRPAEGRDRNSSKPGSPSETRKVPRSILRSHSSHSSAAAALASAMLSPGHREVSSLSKISNPDVLASGQNGIVPHPEEEDFDMEGALDDLGSFLSTWDAEKQGTVAAHMQ